MTSGGPKPFADLLLADLEHFGESLWRNDEIGESRFNFFLTLTTSVIAGLAALYAAKDGPFEKEMLPYVARTALAGLFIFGVMTYLRLLQKNRVTEEYHETLRYIRQRLAGLDPPVLPYVVPQEVAGARTVRWLKGGLAEMAGFLTAGLFALLVYSFASEVEGPCRVALAVGAGTILAIGLAGAAIRTDA